MQVPELVSPITAPFSPVPSMKYSKTCELLSIKPPRYVLRLFRVYSCLELLKIAVSKHQLTGAVLLGGHFLWRGGGGCPQVTFN